MPFSHRCPAQLINSSAEDRGHYSSGGLWVPCRVGSTYFPSPSPAGASALGMHRAAAPGRKFFYYFFLSEHALLCSSTLQSHLVLNQAALAGSSWGWKGLTCSSPSPQKLRGPNQPSLHKGLLWAIPSPHPPPSAQRGRQCLPQATAAPALPKVPRVGSAPGTAPGRGTLLLALPLAQKPVPKHPLSLLGQPVPGVGLQEMCFAGGTRHHQGRGISARAWHIFLSASHFFPSQFHLTPERVQTPPLTWAREFPPKPGPLNPLTEIFF